MRIARAVPAAVAGRRHLDRRGPRAGRAQQKAKADDVGITDTEIRIAVIADVDNPIVPGLFKAGADAVKAWGATINKAGGLAGRKVVVDFIDSKLSANDAAQRGHQGVQRGLRARGHRGALAQQRRRPGDLPERAGRGHRDPRAPGAS